MRKTDRRDSDLLLISVGLLLGFIAAAAYGAWRAVSVDAASAAHRWSTFAEALLFPGSIAVLAIAAIVWLGWKANIDG